MAAGRRWQAGRTGRCGGILWRVVAGYKTAADLRLEFRVNGEWVPVHLEVVWLLADFFFDNEEVLYPRADGYEGGFKLLNSVAAAAMGGWEGQAAELRREQAAARAREAEPADREPAEVFPF